MAIRRSILQALYDDASFEILYFNPFYRNKFLAKDTVLLEAYQDTTAGGEKMIPVSLEKTGPGKSFGNEREYSTYRLNKDDIKTILDTATDDSVEYILFEPVLWKEDKRYLAYEIVPADAAKMPLPYPVPVFQPEPELTFAHESVAPQGAQRATALALMGTSGGRLTMNPSPPATSNLK